MFESHSVSSKCLFHNYLNLFLFPLFKAYCLLITFGTLFYRLDNNVPASKSRNSKNPSSSETIFLKIFLLLSRIFAFLMGLSLFKDGLSGANPSLFLNLSLNYFIYFDISSLVRHPFSLVTILPEYPSFLRSRILRPN